VYDAADGRIDGGAGTDVLRIAASGLTLDLSAISNSVIINTEVVDLTGTGNKQVECHAFRRAGALLHH
jgi:hypothetical protein